MPRRPLRIATTRQFERAVRTAGFETYVLPELPSLDTHRPMEQRLKDGGIYQPFLEDNDIDLVLDYNTGALTLVPSTEHAGQYDLTTAAMGIPYVACYVDPITSTMQQAKWEHHWQVLESPSWIKWIWEVAHSQELTHLGVPNILTLPMAAPDDEYDTNPLPTRKSGSILSFIGHPGSGWFKSKQAVTSDVLYPGLLAAAVHGDLPDLPFHKIFYDLYQFAEPPQPSDDFATRAQKSAAYYNAKFIYNAYLALKQRDRWARFLQLRLGDSFELVGDHWGNDYGLKHQPTIRDRQELYRRMREVPICLNLMKGNIESGVILRHFEITACGGFMLTYPTPELSQYFEIGTECDVFHNESELLEKVAYYLDHDKERREIAAAGQRRTLKEHLYSHRVTRLVELLHEAKVLPRQGATQESADAPAPPTSVETPQTRTETVTVPAPTVAPRTTPGGAAPGQGSDPTLLILQNPGRVSRFYLQGMERAARRLGIRTLVFELDQMWKLNPPQRAAATPKMEEYLRRENVRAVLGYCMNGTAEWACTPVGDDCILSMFDRLGIDHLHWWTDHPQWASEKHALDPKVQPLLRSGRKQHFLKSQAHADELTHLLGWQNCHALPVAEDPELVQPALDVTPAHDVVVITGAPPRPIAELEPFLKQDDPDVAEIEAIIAAQVREGLATLWRNAAPAPVQPALTALGEDWAQRRQHNLRRATFYHYQALEQDHPEASDWLRQHPRLYFDAAEVIWAFLGWQRTFIVTYLAQHFDVAVFGRDWSAHGAPGGEWVEYEQQAQYYARGKLALNISQRNEEEGASHKPFQIAASGAAQVHIDRPGIGHYFEPGREIALFDTPGEARQLIAELLADDERRRALAKAGRARFLRDHTWDTRLPQLLAAAGLHWPCVPGSEHIPNTDMSPALA